MTIKVCDCCEKQIEDHVSFYICYTELHDDKGLVRATKSKEYCGNCFNKLLEKLNLEKK